MQCTRLSRCPALPYIPVCSSNRQSFCLFIYLFVSASGLDLCLHLPPTGQPSGVLLHISSSCTRFWSFKTPHVAQASLRFLVPLRMTLKSYLRASTSPVLGSQATLFGLLFNHPNQDAQREPQDNLLDFPCLLPLFAIIPIGLPFAECHHFKLFYKWIPQPGICWDRLFVSADLPGDSPKMLCVFSRVDVCRQSKQD